jgi:hypothetical protein
MTAIAVRFDHNRVIISHDKFVMLPPVTALHLIRVTWCQYRALIPRGGDGPDRWHIVERQVSFGEPFVLAREIIVRLPAVTQRIAA